VARRPRTTSKPRALSGQPIDSSRGAQQLGEASQSRSPQQPADEPDAEEAFLLLQSAISKQYMAKLIEFRRNMTPEALDSIRALLPPEEHAELDAIIREAQALGGGDEAPLSEAERRWAQQRAELLEAGIDAADLELTPDEVAAWDAFQDPSMPEDFLTCGGHCSTQGPRPGLQAAQAAQGGISMGRSSRSRATRRHLHACDQLHPWLRCPRLTHRPRPTPRLLPPALHSYLALMMPPGTEEEEVFAMVEALPSDVVKELQVGSLCWRVSTG
jgi:hypothetical protein